MRADIIPYFCSRIFYDFRARALTQADEWEIEGKTDIVRVFVGREVKSLPGSPLVRQMGPFLTL